MELTILDAINAGGNAGLLIIGVAILRLERRVLKLELEKELKDGKQTQCN